MAQLQVTESKNVALCARLLFPVSGKPLSGAVLTLSGERIVAVGENASGSPALDLGNVAILPGLVNAHTHLEFSELATPLGLAGESLPAWIRKVIAYRRDSGQSQSAHVLAGLAESARSGTTTIGEIATAPWPQVVSPHADVTVFYELIGLLSPQIEPRLAAAEAHLDESWAARSDCRAGLSPHAPYSVHPELFRRLTELAGRRQVPLAMHLAESPEELELLAAGDGPMRDLLEELQVWSPDTFKLGTRILDYLHGLTAAPRALAIHGNYLAADEIEFLAEHADRMAVVYCPRTHARFGHPRYPLDAMLAAGVSMALGTDSRASNPDLSLLEEMRHVARHHPEIEPSTVLELGTLSGAHALGVHREVGTLTAGKLANLTVVPLPERDSEDPYELLFDSNLSACQTWFRGRQLLREGSGPD